MAGVSSGNGAGAGRTVDSDSLLASERRQQQALAGVVAAARDDGGRRERVSAVGSAHKNPN
ncbi:UNVERIFIED_CONTAM: hypothetical protein Slati_4427000 [Sesamum latifolium]|uniref:Uncharacterized protein n=1 Tax=Sesamum latifolium TaxID=2727402 RepID=A0AAW2SRZ3_9LAMI